MINGQRKGQKLQKFDYSLTLVKTLKNYLLLMAVKNFTDLKVWVTGIEIAKETADLVKRFPRYEQFSLCNQMRRCSVSIPSNIAEGFDRFSKKEFVRFLLISLGSCGELQTQLEIALALGYISEAPVKNFKDKVNHEKAMIKNLIKKYQDR